MVKLSQMYTTQVLYILRFAYNDRMKMVLERILIMKQKSPVLINHTALQHNAQIPKDKKK